MPVANGVKAREKVLVMMRRGAVSPQDRVRALQHEPRREKLLAQIGDVEAGLLEVRGPSDRHHGREKHHRDSGLRNQVGVYGSACP
jgi:hypothetical protein